jgi:uncharacterized YccA/Bax inhibitor family protein
MFRSSNPVLREEVFRPDQWRGNQVGPLGSSSKSASLPGVMTVQGAAMKTALLTAILAVSAVATATLTVGSPTGTLALVVGGIVAAILGLVMYFKPTTSPYLAPAYAVFKGAFVGVLTLLYATKFQFGKAIPADLNLIGQAVGLTIAVAGGVSIAYAMRIIRLGSTAKKVIFGMVTGLALFYLAQMLLSLVFNINFLGAVHGSGPIGIGFSIFVIALAALTLVWEFQTVEEGAAAGAPKYMEWYCAYGILVAIVWLYIEILRLLSKLRSK